MSSKMSESIFESSTEYSKDLPNINEQKRYWDDRWDRNKEADEWSIERAKIIVGLLKTLKIENPKIIDIGCGTGWFSKQLSNFGHVIGVDLSEEAIRLASSKYANNRFIAGDLFELTIPDREFDIAVALEVIAHVDDQHGFVDRVANILRTNGFCVLTTVNKFVINRVEFEPEQPGHIKKWLSKRELKKILRRRFRILKISTTNPIGNKGVLRLTNSFKVNSFIEKFISRRSLEAAKNFCGLGFTRIILLQKKKNFNGDNEKPINRHKG